MRYSIWEALAKRHVWYRELLAKRIAEWPEERVTACNDIKEVAQAEKLADRALRHEERMQRHMDRAMRMLPTGLASH